MNNPRSLGLQENEEPDWKNHGLRIIRSGELDTNTPQTPGMNRAEAISHLRVGLQGQKFSYVRYLTYESNVSYSFCPIPTERFPA
jgi:uncharacterized RmlC-like cupin family protein